MFMRVNFCPSRASSLLALVAAWSVCLSASGQEPPGIQEKPPATPSKEELEKKFQDTLRGATLSGHFTDDNKPQAAAKDEKYTIDSVTKLPGDYWLFTARIQYGDHDATLPLPLRVLWAGDTPVITLDSVPIPGFGTFSARVMIHDGRYAGTWSGATHGGLLFGRVTKQ